MAELRVRRSPAPGRSWIAVEPASHVHAARKAGIPASRSAEERRDARGSAVRARLTEGESRYWEQSAGEVCSGLLSLSLSPTPRRPPSVPPVVAFSTLSAASLLALPFFPSPDTPLLLSSVSFPIFWLRLGLPSPSGPPVPVPIFRLPPGAPSPSWRSVPLLALRLPLSAPSPSTLPRRGPLRPLGFTLSLAPDTLSAPVRREQARNERNRNLSSAVASSVPSRGSVFRLAHSPRFSVLLEPPGIPRLL